ncbi:hypothetical protein [Streptomyces sp. 796.1]|uniref:hypothetical protein n=1 Tax=Streptomyces sp. 796.1 TaxID=3163029 RepID=UPI0039C9EF31
MKQSASHILDAQRKITGRPGASTPLHRITNEKTIDAHGWAMYSKVHKPQPQDLGCVECPFAASKEGGNHKRGSTRIISRGGAVEPGPEQEARPSGRCGGGGVTLPVQPTPPCEG